MIFHRIKPPKHLIKTINARKLVEKDQCIILTLLHNRNLVRKKAREYSDIKHSNKDTDVGHNDSVHNSNVISSE